MSGRAAAAGWVTLFVVLACSHPAEGPTAEPIGVPVAPPIVAADGPAVDASRVIASLDPGHGRPVGELVAALEGLELTEMRLERERDLQRLHLLRWLQREETLPGATPGLAAFRAMYTAAPQTGGLARPFLEAAEASALLRPPPGGAHEINVGRLELSVALVRDRPADLAWLRRVWEEIAAQQRAIGVPMETFLGPNKPALVGWCAAWAKEAPGDGAVAPLRWHPTDSKEEDAFPEVANHPLTMRLVFSLPPPGPG